MTINWRKSRRSQDDLNSNCVELSTNTPDATLVQDSKNPGVYLTLSAGELASFVNRVRSGNLDH
ncbi:DUF397 domain-containing protein [Actinocorallia sp. A-T 12471]|uniref:DUF397 domain-containing protein n=1 Tax=Actinocorallia sp. A-T 12471 TaxID=3089813 RepID=UPI0029CAEB64|nr:DUF397 domain-containing protein [Actinocorallia sp. A-T 12471]MDX6743391.1 DUF397 domain-containing protein [Actinocorallia sp. A-T 12471]